MGPYFELHFEYASEKRGNSFKNIYLFIYLAFPGFSSCMWDFLVEACDVVVAAGGI